MKIYTKKTLLVIAAVGAMFTSCNKSTTTTTDPVPTPEKEVEKTAEFVVVVLPSQKNYTDQEYEFDVNGTKVKFKESEMTEMTDNKDISRVPELTSGVLKAVDTIDGKTPKIAVQYLKYNLGKLKKGQTVKSVGRTVTVKSDRPSTEDCDFFFGYALLVDDKEITLTNVSYHKGVENKEEYIKKIYNSVYKNFNVSYTCK